MVTGETSRTGGLKCLLWPSILTVLHIPYQTWRSWSLNYLPVVTHVCERLRKEGGSGPWRLRSLQAWISGLIACETFVSLHLLYTFGFPLPSLMLFPSVYDITIPGWLIDFLPLHLRTVNIIAFHTILQALDEDQWSKRHTLLLL